MMDDSRSVILETFKRIKLTVNKRIARGFMPQWIPYLAKTNNTRDSFRV
jgi:hypothetical protein